MPLGIGLGISPVFRAGDTVDVPSGSDLTPLNNLVAGLGDSITNANSSSPGTVQAQLTDAAEVGGYLTWASILPVTGEDYGNGRLRWGRTYATGGYLTSQVKDEHLPELLAADPLPGFAVIASGANDAGEGQTQTGGVVIEANMDAWQSDMEYMYDACLSAGIIPVGFLPFPHDDAEYQVALAEMRTRVVAMCEERDIPYMDAFTGINTAGAFSTGMSHDGIHPSCLGAKVAGQSLRDVLDDWLLDWYPILADGNNDRSTMMLWANGSSREDRDADGIPDGGIPPVQLDPWTLTAQGAALTIGSRTDFVGNAIRFNKSTDPDTTQLQSSASNGVAPVLTVGDTYGIGFMAEVADWDASTFILLDFHDSADVTIKQARLNIRNDSEFVDPIAPFVWYQEVETAASFNKLRMTWQIGGTGTNTADFYIGAITVADVAELEYVDLSGEQVVDSGGVLVIR